MGRGMAAKGKRRPRKGSPPEAAVAEAVAGDNGKDRPGDAASGGGGGFFCCYLLQSLCPRRKGRTYIGFTVNPRRRIRQHNGEIRCGASRTKRGRPWEMVLCIHGFPTNVSALQVGIHPDSNPIIRSWLLASVLGPMSSHQFLRPQNVRLDGSWVGLLCFLLKEALFSWLTCSSSGRGSTRRRRWPCARPPPASSRSAASATRSSSPTPCSTSPHGKSKARLHPVLSMHFLLFQSRWYTDDVNGGCVATLNLTVNFFSTKNTMFTAGCPALPSHMKTVVCPMEDLQCYADGLSSEEDKDSGDEPRENQEPDVPFGDEHSHHGLLPVEEDSRIAGCEPSIDAFASMEWSRTFGAGELGGSRITESSEVQPVGEEIRTAGCDVQCPNDEFAYMEWSGIHETRELDELRTSPRCTLSLCSDDDGGRIVDCVLRQLSPMSTAGASSFDDGGHLLHERDVVDLVTPVGRLGRKGGKVATICPKIIDLTSSPIIIEL